MVIHWRSQRSDNHADSGRTSAVSRLGGTSFWLRDARSTDQHVAINHARHSDPRRNHCNPAGNYRDSRRQYSDAKRRNKHGHPGNNFDNSGNHAAELHNSGHDSWITVIQRNTALFWREWYHSFQRNSFHRTSSARHSCESVQSAFVQRVPWNDHPMRE